MGRVHDRRCQCGCCSDGSSSRLRGIGCLSRAAESPQWAVSPWYEPSNNQYTMSKNYPSAAWISKRKHHGWGRTRWLVRVTPAAIIGLESGVQAGSTAHRENARIRCQDSLGGGCSGVSLAKLPLEQPRLSSAGPNLSMLVGIALCMQRYDHSVSDRTLAATHSMNRHYPFAQVRLRNPAA